MSEMSSWTQQHLWRLLRSQRIQMKSCWGWRPQPGTSVTQISYFWSSGFCGCEFSQVSLKYTVDAFPFQFLSLRKGALLVSAFVCTEGTSLWKHFAGGPKSLPMCKLVLAVKTVPDPTEQQKEELQGKAEMQLLSVPTSGWDFMGYSSSSFSMTCKCPAMQTLLFCSSSCPMPSQATFPGRLTMFNCSHVPKSLADGCKFKILTNGKK